MNKAVRGLVIDSFGADAWNTIRAEAGCPDEPFISMESYPDELTVKLVQIASTRLNIPLHDLLVAFGRHWMLYTSEIGYGGLLPATGQTMVDFLKNLNNLHTRLRLCLPHLEPPVITVEDVRPESLVVHYSSARTGLSPVALGILQGLGQRFDLSVTVTAESRAVPSGEYTVFTICWAPANTQTSAPENS